VRIDDKAMLTLGYTQVPLIFISDRTHLPNFAGDKKVSPVCMSFGIESSRMSKMSSRNRVLLVTLLPIPIKNHDIPQEWLHEHRLTN